MSYRILLALKATSPDLALDKIIGTAEEVLWPPDDEDCVTSLSGCSEGGDKVEPDSASLLVYRELCDDVSCIEEDEHAQSLPMIAALERQFSRELRGDIAERLTKAGLSVVSANYTTQGSTEQQVEKVNRASDRWAAGRKVRVTAMQDYADLKAHARVLAKRGEPAESGWPPEVMGEYEAVAKIGIEERLERVVSAAADDHVAMIAALEDMTAYAKAVAAHVKAGRAAASKKMAG